MSQNTLSKEGNLKLQRISPFYHRLRISLIYHFWIAFGRCWRKCL